MKHIAKPDDKLHMYSMGKRLRVTAIFTDIDEANKHMNNTDDAVIACFGGFIICANQYDKGVTA